MPSGKTILWTAAITLAALYVLNRFTPKAKAFVYGAGAPGNVGNYPTSPNDPGP